jgi:zinc/manganese transport system substrate-binding protein
MTKLRYLIAALALVAPGARAAHAKLRVVTTVPDLAAIARAVAGERAEVSALLLPSQDPHYADARPHLALLLNRASLLVVAGLGLEVGWLPVLQTGARNPAIQRGASGYLDASTVAQLKEVPREKLDRSMGDIHPGGNPHYLTDPENGVRVARAIAARLGKLDPSAASAFAKNAADLATAVHAASKRWLETMKPFRGTPIVAYHRSWVYFAAALGLRIVEHLEPKPGIPPSAAHVLHVLQAMRAARVPLILQEEYYPDRTAQLVAQKAGAKLVVVRGGADVRKGESYVARLDAMVRAVAEALRSAKR